ncbi:DNA-directed primase/polymerase protein-like [Phymastichus coffea]|uniref:DNA-directed primase/polymerase protein-like n=1 Tax=Phymastichus coffea TaxID=108790 RepID=UPI00273CE029|nr:DNA-directed primase/polymerase protein-like [Phymastichus coffea]XP_058797759.1 DNA-directed primase/polymerase protein-like [Phymastichus coffea]XP_058797760.1 DNA-directed primase/polymerase protein-like [Phymastichus coffea]
MNDPITSTKFYGNSLINVYNGIEKKIEKAKHRRPVEYEDRHRTIFEPLPYKKEFWKQSDALADAAEYSQGPDILCCFVFQDENERRRFIVTYPEDFWNDLEHCPPERRVFYEVIPENSPCFLYYDLEFNTEMNKDNNGIRMTQTVIDLTCEYIKKYWKYPCSRNEVINLDSSRVGKFSKHLIFHTKEVAFENNFQVGYLVKSICTDIINFVSCESTEHDILSKFDKSNLTELFVETNKGKKLFIDINVYTKNRHFRIYKATKWGKNSHLLHASDCEYVWNNTVKNKDMNIFINSLISYLPKKKKLMLLTFDENKKAQIQSYSQNAEARLKQSFMCKEYPKSPYPALNKYIAEFVQPGKIRDTKYMETRQLIIFEIIGNRYCDNIGRWHKSNNIYYIVDLINKIMYQKCHDEDCRGFVSTPKALPVEVTFHFSDTADSVLSTINC